MDPVTLTAMQHTDPIELLILRILRRGLTGSLVGGALGMAAGCGEHAASDPITGSDTSFVLGACATGSSGKLRASGLRPSMPLDYVSIRRVDDHSNQGSSTADDDEDDGWRGSVFMTLSESGTACATASGSECADKVAHHPAEFVRSSCVQTCTELSIVTTRGDEVKRWASEDELRELLGDIDSSDEALLLAMRAGYRDVCAKEEADGYKLEGTNHKSTCPVTLQRVDLFVSRTGDVQVGAARVLRNRSRAEVCIGRVPAALTSVSRARHHSALGDYLAHCAHLEDASVYAFEWLARELTEHGAPRTLVAEALHAADDEVRHARIVAALARAHAGHPVAAEVAPLPTRSLEEIAIENGTEGCIRETYGALIGGYQARRAGDARVRAAMVEIAADEARHAALSHRVHHWALAQLDAEGRARVQKAQRQALAQLHAECAVAVRPEVRDALGLPTPVVAQALLHELAEALWLREAGAAA